MSLTNKSPSETYKDILYVNNSNTGFDGTVRRLKSGDGTSSSLLTSTNALQVKPSSDNTAVLDVKNSGGTTKFLVDTTNNYVKANGVFVNTQYAVFGVGFINSLGYAANTHHPLPFVTNDFGLASSQDNITFGTDDEPATSFTTADGVATDAALLVPMMWYVHDNISIDGVTSLEGGEDATGDTTRMHLYSYTFTSGSTSALTSGTLLAHNSDVTNTGSEAAFLSTWSIDSASVASGKVILAFFRSDSINSDYSVSVSVKYHLTG